MLTVSLICWILVVVCTVWGQCQQDERLYRLDQEVFGKSPEEMEP